MIYKIHTNDKLTRHLSRDKKLSQSYSKKSIILKPKIISRFNHLAKDTQSKFMTKSILLIFANIF